MPVFGGAGADTLSGGSGALHDGHNAGSSTVAGSAEAEVGYENLSLLYVAMTRAKRAMYVLTKPPGKSVSRNFPRLLAATLGEFAAPVDAVEFADGTMYVAELASGKVGDIAFARRHRGEPGLARRQGRRHADGPDRKIAARGQGGIGANRVGAGEGQGVDALELQTDIEGRDDQNGRDHGLMAKIAQPRGCRLRAGRRTGDPNLHGRSPIPSMRENEGVAAGLAHGAADIEA